MFKNRKMILLIYGNVKKNFDDYLENIYMIKE